MPCHAMLCYAMLCYAMLCYAMLCYAMLCYVMLRPCHAMPCHALSCHAHVTNLRTRTGAMWNLEGVQHSGTCLPSSLAVPRTAKCPPGAAPSSLNLS